MNGRRACVAAVAALGTLVAAPMAGAATLTVDDDGADCPGARYKSIQNAIFAADPGDTIAICPGEYVEGGGGVGSNGLIVLRDLTIKGAGADLVTIKPKRVRANGGQIAETTNPSLRNNVGSILLIDGADTQYAPLADQGDQVANLSRRVNKKRTSLLTVNISGVTIDGDGVYAESGVLFRDAQGSITRSRITNIVTTETSFDTPRPGEYKGSNDGYAIASVTAPPPATPAAPAGSPALQPDTAPLPATPRVIQIDHTRIDRYNAAGVLLDGATNDAPPLTASGIVSRGVLGQNQIVGRTLCVNFLINGSCQPAGNPVPPLDVARNGPLYGQDGVRITAGSSATITDSLLSQNLVQGTGAPNRTGASTANDQLSKAAGVRLIGAGASVLLRNNIVDNSYGVFNVNLDGTTPNTTVPVKAENNWWGLRSGPSTNNGPAISPTTNPTPPENPVNGAPVPDGTGTTSNAVDFFPFRNGLQSDPNSGEFPVFEVPGPVNDSAPTITLASDASTYARGATARLTATPADDFGVRRVTFYDGSAIVGSADRAPYAVNYKIPTDVLCTTRTLSAVVTDSAGQSSSASLPIQVDPASCTIAPAPAAPSIAFVNPALKLSSNGTTFTTAPVAAAGVKSVEYFLGNRKACTATAAPWSCKVVPTGADVGLQTLRAVLTDIAGQTAVTSVRVEVPRFAPRSLSLAIKSANKSRNRAQKSFTATLKLPTRVTKAQGCRSGTVTFIVKRAGKIVSDSQSKLTRTCKATARVTAGRTSKKKQWSVTARFGGNTVLLPISSSRRFS